MPTSYITSSPVTGTAYTLIAEDVDVMIAPNVLLAGDGSGGTVIIGLDSFHDVTVAGTIMTNVVGVQLGNDVVDDAFSTLNVTRGGQILSQNSAVYIRSSESTVFNDGLISGRDVGIVVHADNSASAVVNNSGRIEASRFFAIQSNGLFGLNNLTVDNSGVISGISGGSIYSVGTTRITNSGTIQGTIQTDAMADSVTNRGMIEGVVYLGQGSDRIDNRGGTIDGQIDLGSENDLIDNRGGTITAQVNLGDGVDTFILGTGVELVEGGSGSQDMLDVRGGTGGLIDLGEGTGTGLAQGDTLTGFERVMGSWTAADTILGDGAANLFYGYGGADSLDGDAGSDILYGGRGIDTLTGGAGSETFGFLSLSDIGDVITDFSSTGAGNDDRIIIRAISFGGGLVAGALNPAQFQSRADNAAQDSNDRFIFRTTDRTLWFDADATGAGAAVLVADLQAGALLTALDIVLI